MYITTIGINSYKVHIPQHLMAQNAPIKAVTTSKKLERENDLPAADCLYVDRASAADESFIVSPGCASYSGLLLIDLLFCSYWNLLADTVRVKIFEAQGQVATFINDIGEGLYPS